MDAHDQYLFIVRPVENADFAAFGNALLRAPEEVVIQLFAARRLESVNIASLRIHAGHDVLDHAILSGRVHGLEDD
jgi:hypothetical protein